MKYILGLIIYCLVIVNSYIFITAIENFGRLNMSISFATLIFNIAVLFSIVADNREF